MDSLISVNEESGMLQEPQKMIVVERDKGQGNFLIKNDTLRQSDRPRIHRSQPLRRAGWSTRIGRRWRWSAAMRAAAHAPRPYARASASLHARRFRGGGRFSGRPLTRN